MENQIAESWMAIALTTARRELEVDRRPPLTPCGSATIQLQLEGADTRVDNTEQNK
jgi:hypothetical protein